MEEKTIELELRAKLSSQDIERLKEVLTNMGTLDSYTKRLSVMCFGVIGEKKIDIRIRVTNGDCEVVVKSGSFGAHNRVERAQKISQEQFLGMVKIFAQLGFSMKVGGREIINYKLSDNIMVSLVLAGQIAYVELEKMSSKSDLDENYKQLQQLADRLTLNLLQSEADFNELCEDLTKTVDWQFNDTIEDYEKLKKIFKNYIKNK